MLLILTCSCQRSAGHEGTPFSSGTAVSKNGSAYTLEIVPQKADRNAVFTAVAGNFNFSDARITWLIDGQPVPDAAGPQLKSSDLKKGDTVQASAVVAGATIQSNPVEIKNSPPEITGVKLMPETLKAGDVLYAEATARDADGDDVSIAYEWTVNEQPAGADRRLATMPKRGDRISVKVIPFDGTDYGDPVVAEKTIINMPPVIVDHKEFNFDGKVYTYQVRASDPDGDALAYSLESPVDGMTIDSSTGLLKWIVPPEFKGAKSAVIVVSDGNGGTGRFNLGITIP